MKLKILLSMLVGTLLVGGTAFSKRKIVLNEPAKYEKMTAVEKRDFLWNKGILATEFRGKLPKYDDIKLMGMMFARMKKKMNTQNDFKPRKWKKYIHRRSVVAKVRYVPSENSPYSGILAAGGIGLLRASLTYKPEKRGVAPGLALKMFLDGEPSANVSFLTGLDSQGQDYNFFKKSFTNVVVPSKKFGAKIVAWIFKRASKYFNMISMDDLAKFNTNGTKVAKKDVSYPLQVFIKPTTEINFPSTPKRDIRNDFLNLDLKGKAILKVYARLNENRSDFYNINHESQAQYEEQAVEIGQFILESDFKASSFGDDQLFFKHSKF